MHNQRNALGNLMTDLIVVEVRPMAGRVVLIEPGTTIGRDGCDVVLPDPEVSRRHAVLNVIDGAPVIEDTGSTNGTWVNGRRIEGRMPLKAGDTVELGNTVWRVEASCAVTRVGRPASLGED
jgi:pSer/pThr/pTyr-binding forkhead associated (FHA) protein